MKVAIVGSRNFPNLERVRAIVFQIKSSHPDATIVSGGARGVDATAEKAAIKLGMHVLSYRPFSARGVVDKQVRWGYDVFEYRCGRLVRSFYQGTFDEWRTFADAAKGRNTRIVAGADQVLAFWDGESRGTKDSIDKAKADPSVGAVWVISPVRGSDWAVA